MDVIKTSPNVEFDVIYNDCTRHHVKEGILFEVDGESLISHNATDRLAVLLAIVEGGLELLDYVGATKLFATELKQAGPDTPAYKPLLKICDTFRSNCAEKQAVFRLGQMDMRDSIADMLEAEAKNNALGIVAATLRVYVDKVRAMGIPIGRAPIENT